DRHPTLTQQDIVGINTIGDEVDEHRCFFRMFAVFSDGDELRWLQIVLGLTISRSPRQERQLEVATITGGFPGSNQLIAPQVLHRRVALYNRQRFNAASTIV